MQRKTLVLSDGKWITFFLIPVQSDTFQLKHLFLASIKAPLIEALSNGWERSSRVLHISDGSVGIGILISKSIK